MKKFFFPKMPDAATQTTLSLRPSDLLCIQGLARPPTIDVGCQCDSEELDDPNLLSPPGSPTRDVVSYADTVSIADSEGDSGYESISDRQHIIDIQLMIDDEMELEFLRDTGLAREHYLSLDQLYEYILEGTIPPNWAQ
jgi:hypothetical protein